MKYAISLFFVAGVMMLGATACKEKKQSEDIIVTKYEPEKPKAPVKMRTDVRSTDITWQGRQYVVRIAREPADSLPMVTDEIGQKYVDNRVSMRISRSDSTVFMQKTFTKASFASYLNDDFRNRGVLENIVFHEVDGKTLEFAVIITHPDADDEFIPLELSIDPMGGLTIEQGTLLDDERDDLDDADEEE